MKKIIQCVFCLCCISYAVAQTNPSKAITAENYTIINDQKDISNQMIFAPSPFFKANKKPLILVNNKEVFTLAYYNRDEVKTITVLSPAKGLAKYGNKGRHGVILVQLKEEVTIPLVEVSSNRLYYRCTIAGKTVDTSKTYFDSTTAKNCSVLDLSKSDTILILYKDFPNEITIKHLGVGWDMTSLYISGAYLSGTGNRRLIHITKETDVKLTITTCAGFNKECDRTEIPFKVLPLPALQKQQ